LVSTASNAFSNNTNTAMGSFSNGNGNGMVYPSGLVSPSMSQTAAAATATMPSGNPMSRSNQFPLSQSPVGIDLGEFMIDSDLDFLGKLFFDLSRNGDGGQVGGTGGAGGPATTPGMGDPPPSVAGAASGGGTANRNSGHLHHPSNPYNV
jgi:hypothetical protein